MTPAFYKNQLKEMVKIASGVVKQYVEGFEDLISLKEPQINMIDEIQ